MRWPWQKKPKEDNGGKLAELEMAKRKAEDLARRTRRLVTENGLAADIRRALGSR